MADLPEVEGEFAMKERPIIFSTEMVEAILDGRKFQTRRVIKPQPWHRRNERPPNQWCWARKGRIDDIHEFMKVDHAVWWDKVKSPQSMLHFCPYGQPGDLLWVRETFKITSHNTSVATVEYKDGDTWFRRFGEQKIGRFGVWRPSIHMPRWASRITLEVTGVRVERVRDISYHDAIAEGCPTDNYHDVHPVSGKQRGDIMGRGRIGPTAWFANLWDSINAKRGYSWASNPWTWVVEFERR